MKFRGKGFGVRNEGFQLAREDNLIAIQFEMAWVLKLFRKIFTRKWTSRFT